jgi:peptidoglycan/xylan/chitin deacetylase (PgdA/CDA1 family)
LDLLDRFGIKSTFFIPGHSAVAFPGADKDDPRGRLDKR